MPSEMRKGLRVLTNSRISRFKQCPRAEWLSYGMGLRRQDVGEALRGGAAFHNGLDVLNQTGDIEKACDALSDSYRLTPDWADPYLWRCEEAKFHAMLRVYEWRWREHRLEIVHSEHQFQVPIINPTTKRKSITFDRAGKIDAIVRLEDGRLAVKETKTNKDDLGDESDYWLRLRRDEQISGYVISARKLGIPVETVLYDVVRKPAIRPQRATPIESRKYRKDGELYANQREADEPVVDYFTRCFNELTDNYPVYFVRKEIPRLQVDLDKYEHELWQVADSIRSAYNNGHHYRNTNACCIIDRECEFHKEICDMEITEQTALPNGWQRVNSVHQELNLEFSETTASPTA